MVAGENVLMCFFPPKISEMCRGRFHHGIFQIPFHSIPFQVFPVELEWNFPFVCTYVLRKLYQVLTIMYVK